jgi:hypothetical protein
VAWGCTLASCKSRDVALPGSAQERPFLRTTSPTIGLTGTVDATPLFAVDLPRPVR